MKIEGRNAVFELIKSGKNIDKLYIERNPQGSLNKIFAQAREAGIRVQFVDREVLDKNSREKRHQGVIAFCEDYAYCDLDDILSGAKEDALIILCDGIEDVHNLGSILRVAECVGADGVVIPAVRSAYVTEAVIRISAGAANYVKVAKVTSINYALQRLKDNGFWTYALEVSGDEIYNTHLTGRTALVIGGEDTGVKRLTRELCDGVLALPMKGKVNSLNASVALGVAAYEVLRQRGKNV